MWKLDKSTFFFWQATAMLFFQSLLKNIEGNHAGSCIGDMISLTSNLMKWTAKKKKERNLSIKMDATERIKGKERRETLNRQVIPPL